MALDDRHLKDRRALQVSAWRGDRQRAVVNPTPEHPHPSADAVAAELERLRHQGITEVLTGALHEPELAPFLANGFRVHERLHLLRHDLVHLPPVDPDVRIRRAWRRDHAAALAIDARAFDAFWTLDRAGLDDAVRATPLARFRVSTDGRGPVTGYAVTGRSGPNGYLQRLAVDPDRHRQGIGRALVADALRWLQRSGVRVGVVNTQEGNAGALALYEACGFVREPSGLTVLALHLGPGPVAGPPGRRPGPDDR